MNMCDYLENKVIDWLLRGQTFTPPATSYIGLIVASRGYSNNNRSTAVSLGDTILPATANGHLYRCTTAGTTGAGEPTWPTANSGTVADGTAVWTEAYTYLEAGTFTEVSTSSTGYGRVSVASSLANWAGTQGSGTTVASSGTSGTTSNNASITFGSPIAQWGVIFGMFWADASTAGNILFYAALTVPKTVNNGDAAPSFAAAALSLQIDN